MRTTSIGVRNLNLQDSVGCSKMLPRVKGLICVLSHFPLLRNSPVFIITEKRESCLKVTSRLFVEVRMF